MASFADEFLLLCTRSLSGEASVAERERLEEFLQDSACRAFYAELSARWEDWKDEPTPQFDRPAALRRFSQQMAAAKTRATLVERPRRRRSSWPWALAAAAVVTLGLAVWFVRPAPPESEPLVWLERSAAAGETPQIVLADGTRVTLNGQSTLHYPAAFGTQRTVRLSGEAFFDVTHDAAHPFVVEAGGWKTTVLGTKFDVSVLPEDRGSRVALVQGRVAIEPMAGQAGATPVILRPGQQFSTGKGSGPGRVEACEAAEAIGWMDGVLLFHDEPLSEVTARLERRFGVAFEFTTAELPKKAINARFQKESLAEILEILSFAGGVRCEAVRENGAIVRVRIWPAADTNH
jgi:ferric-dicitrate binding protein FerR (iron transport regulator)